MWSNKPITTDSVSQRVGHSTSDEEMNDEKTPVKNIGIPSNGYKAVRDLLL